MAKKEQTSRKVASAASKVLKDPKSTKAANSTARSSITQAGNRKKPNWHLLSKIGRMD